MLDQIFQYLPEVTKTKYKLGFNEKLKWTLTVLFLYFLLGQIPLFGLDPAWTTDYFEAVRAIIAGHFGSIITLGIGPIVTAGIILQLLVGAELLPLDLSKAEDKKTFQGMQQGLTILVALFESAIYVLFGGLPPVQPTIFFQLILIVQLFAGSMLVVILDELSSKWGFISGVSLFIAAGVSAQIMVAAFNPLPSPTNPGVPAGRIWASLQYFSNGDPMSAFALILPLVFTVIVFMGVVWAQSINVEIPLAYSRISGVVVRWPLNLFYTGNIPVILAVALLANFQLWARTMDSRGIELFGHFENNQAITGLMHFMTPPRDLAYSLVFNTGAFFQGVMANLENLGAVPLYQLTQLDMLIRAITYSLFMIFGAVLFAVFWVKTVNLGADAVAEQIEGAGMQIRGFRRDTRVLEMMLKRYIPYLTVLGGAAIGFLAAFADFTNSIGGGTGILLMVMIIYQLYQSITRERLVDAHPLIRDMIQKA
jgi:preprotein translocase subunit SecY